MIFDTFLVAGFELTAIFFEVNTFTTTPRGLVFAMLSL